MSSYAEKLERFRGRQESLVERKAGVERAIAEMEKKTEDIAKAQVVIQTVAQQTQEQLRFHIESIVSKALAAVFAEPYGFVVEFETKRGQTEAKFWFERDGERVSPIDATGGGAVDIAAFALRVTMWSMGKTRPTIILDEPFRFVSRDLQTKAGAMMKMLSEDLGLQFIMVTHNTDLIDEADEVFKVRMENGESVVLID